MCTEQRNSAHTILLQEEWNMLQNRKTTNGKFSSTVFDSHDATHQEAYSPYRRMLARVPTRSVAIQDKTTKDLTR